MDFRFNLAADIFKADSVDDDRSRRIAGIVSTDSVDKQSERLIQEGLDFRPFLKSGWFNDNHDQATDAVLGYPELAELRDLGDGRKGWYVEGFILKGYERADRIWALATSLAKSNRRLGFSVEGSVTARDPRDPKTVSKAVVREVAITRCPVNNDTALEVLAKALSAGSAVNDPGVSPGEGFALRAEALEHDEDDDETKAKKKRVKRLIAKGGIRKDEAIVLLRDLDPRLSFEAAARLVDFAAARR